MPFTLFEAIASPRRCEILRLVWREEQSAGAIHRAMPDVTFGAVSLQLRALSEARLVEVRSEQRNRYYKVRKEALGTVGPMLEQMWDDALWKLKLAAELEESRRGPKPGTERRGKRAGGKTAGAARAKPKSTREKPN